MPGGRAGPGAGAGGAGGPPPAVKWPQLVAQFSVVMHFLATCSDSYILRLSVQLGNMVTHSQSSLLKVYVNGYL